MKKRLQSSRTHSACGIERLEPGVNPSRMGRKNVEKVEQVESEIPKGGGVLFGHHTLCEGAGWDYELLWRELSSAAAAAAAWRAIRRMVCWSEVGRSGGDVEW